MKKWCLVYETKKGQMKKPIWPDEEPAGVFRAVVVEDTKVTSHGRFVTVKGVAKTHDGFAPVMATVRTANSAKNIYADRLEVGG